MKRDYASVIPNNILRRPRLTELLRSGLSFALITLAAGPGYGKTNALSDFCNSVKINTIWINLSKFDNDIVCFWGNFIERLKPAIPDLARQLATIKFPETLGELNTFLRLFAAELLSANDFLLIFDHIDHIENEYVQRFIRSTIQANLENLYIILVSNKRESLMPLIADQPHYHIGAEDLKFTFDETCELFENCNRQVDRPILSAIHQETDGWPVALHLIATQSNFEIAQQYHTMPHLQAISELFENHYFSNFSSELQTLLVKLSFFHQIPLGLIQALGVSGPTNTMKILTSNIFVYYNYRDQVFYFQKMYRDFLVCKQVFLGQSATTELLAAAGHWFMEHNLHYEALECFWEIADYANYLNTVLNLPKRNPSIQATNPILDCLNRIPEQYRQDTPAVDFCRGFMYFNDAKINKADTIFSSLISRLSSQPLDAQLTSLLGETYAVMVDIALAKNSTQALAYIKLASELLPEGTHIRTRDVSVVGNNEIFFLPDNQPNQLAHMLDFIAEFSKYAIPFYSGSGRGYSNLFAAEGYFHKGDFQSVLEYTLKAIHAAKDARQHDIVANALYLQMRIAFFQGDFEKASTVLEDLSAYIAENQAASLYPLLDCAKAFFYIESDYLELVPSWLSTRQILPTDAPLETGRDKIISAICKRKNGDYQGAYSSLMELEDIFEERGLWGIRLTSYILLAECLFQMGSPHKSIRCLWNAYNMAYANQANTCFIEFGDSIYTLLDLIPQQSEYQFDPEWIETIKRETAEHVTRQNAMNKCYKNSNKVYRSKSVKLTAREKEVLVFLSQGLTREEIAALLKITLHGVKKHITNIYNKLGAINRADAVHIATINNIIKEPE